MSVLHLRWVLFLRIVAGSGGGVGRTGVLCRAVLLRFPSRSLTYLRQRMCIEFLKLLGPKGLCKHRVAFLYRKNTNWMYQVVS